MFYNVVRYHWERGLQELTPGVERFFKVGDRVLCWHKRKEYSGEVVEVRPSKMIRGYLPHPEVFMRTDQQVDSTEGALLGGFGLRGESSLFRFEEETDEERQAYSSSYFEPIRLEEKEEFRRLSKLIQIRLIKTGEGIPPSIEIRIV